MSSSARKAPSKPFAPPKSLEEESKSDPERMKARARSFLRRWNSKKTQQKADPNSKTPTKGAGAVSQEAAVESKNPATTTKSKRKAVAVAQEDGEEEAPVPTPAPKKAKRLAEDKEGQPAPVAPVKTPAKKAAAAPAKKKAVAAPAPASEVVYMDDTEGAEAPARAPAVTPAKKQVPNFLPFVLPIINLPRSTLKNLL